ncbi:tetratricopeptide repeat protein [Allorhodopirellula solitaria]|uniref:TPR repeat-containing protein YrrB n=1 Tax=Allorhodopirellula solitaria TaxID=2527987 RepID=A0A5C5YF89_9BACT|nr:tetratricopeptide repeat protein [Allorhodopirellula solitaria]TWT73181.1 TPR repeat-containing protein YrrB [Allorhodopirellula solitaria]
MDDAHISQHGPRSHRDPVQRSCRQYRRQLLATFLIGGTLSLSSVGCAGRSMSLASMNPFKAEPSETTAAETPNQLVSSTTEMASGTVTASKNLVAKTSSKIGSWFGRDSEPAGENDSVASDSDPEQLQPDVFVANGQLWESTGNLSKAMESYAKALESDPENGPALTSIARLHFRESRYPESAEYFQKAISQNPQDAALYNDLGLTLSKLEQHELAAQTLQRALELAPGTSRYANNLASVHFESGKTDQALEVLKANNKAAVAHFNMAFLFYKKGQIANAKSQLTQSLAHENEASADPATKRAIDRSREMLAQMDASGQSPASVPSQPTDLPGEVGPAAGPAAIVAAAPAHRSNQAPQVLGQMKPQQKSGTPMTPVSYQDPRSYMAPQLPSDGGASPASTPAAGGAATTPVPTQMPAATPATPGDKATGEAETSPAAAPPSTPPSATGFGLPGGFQFPGT